MEYAVFAAIVVVPFAIGWLYGRNGIDPSTPEGRRYYGSSAKTNTQEGK